jgi:TM2 domain-containing membrane protein YozV
MKAVAIIVNLFFPGVGTMIIGKVGVGVMQIILGLIGAFLIFTGILSIVGFPLLIVAVIWSLVTVANSQTTDPIVVKQETIREVVREVPAQNKETETS